VVDGANEQQELFEGQIDDALRQFAARGAAARKAVDGVLAGLRGRDRGIAAVWQGTDEEWKEFASAAIQLLAGAGEPFTAEEVRELCNDPPGHPNAMGALFQAASRRGLIRFVGYRKATRESLHAHPIGVWIGTRAKAS
jgi:hypothetical protein